MNPSLYRKINFPKIQTIMFWLICAIFVLIRFPSVYIFPFIPSGLFLTHNIARFLILLLSVLAVLVQKNKTEKVDVKMVFLILFYFFTQSISVFQASNLSSFFTVYKDLLISLMLAYGVFITVNRNNIRRFLALILIVTLVSLSFELLTYLLPDIMQNAFSRISNDTYLAFTEFQNGRGRMFGDSFNEIFLPIFFLFISENAFTKVIPSYVALALSFFSTFVSGWRSKAIMFLFSLVSSVVVFGRKHMLLVATSFFILVTVLMAANFLALAINRYSIVERFIDVDTVEIKNDASRLKYWKEASEMTSSAPVFGIGLGNYFDHLSQKSKTENMNDSTLTGVRFVVIDDPHDLFFSTAASTGLLGLASLVLMIGYFLYSDLRTLLKNDGVQSSLILSFWSLFIYAALNPWMYFTYLSLFWLLRGVIEKLKAITNTDPSKSHD